MTKIELHMISFEMNEFKVHDISCKTHPSLSLITAIQMSCALPVLMTPVCIEDQCFIDGGLLCNYPLHFCIESGHQPTEILGIKNMCNQYNNTINANSTLIDFLLNILFKAIYSLNTDNAQPSIPHELLCKTECMTLEMLRTAISSHDVRKELYENGAELAKLFLSTCANEVEDIPVPVFLEIIPDELNDGV
jgi:predicted acylesterase/phospholipase RssA